MRAILRAPAAALPFLARVATALAWTLVVGIGVFATLLLVVRLVVFPNIEHYRDSITAAISNQVHQPISIDVLDTAWDGWNPKLVMTGFRMGARSSKEELALLELPRVELTVSWTSLPLLDLRLKQLVIDKPRLSIRRDEQGVLHLAGIEIDPEQARDDAGVTDWLLRQPEIVVSDALITWTDERRHAPQLVLDRVHFRLDNFFRGHRFGLTGNPPAQLAAPIDVRGDLVAASSRDWQHAEGRLYVRLDYADLAAWREWLPLPIEVTSGKGALRAWFTFAQGEAREIIADVELADVRTRLSRELPELALARVSGRAGWRFASPTREIFCHQLAFATVSGQALEPTNLTILLHATAQGEPEHGRLEFDRLQLAPLQQLAVHLPLPERWRADLRALALQGTLSRGLVQWDGAIDSPGALAIRADFAQLAFVPHGDWPGARGLTGSIDANAQRGEIKLAARQAALELPHVFAAPIAVDAADGEIAWTTANAQITVRTEDFTFSNADAAGKLRGTYRHSGHGPGEVDLEASLTRARADAVPRYVPVGLEGVRAWLARAIKPGALDDVRLVLKGNLASFPFAGDKGGVFAVDFKGRGFGLDYANTWPALSDVDAEVHFHGAGLRVIGSRGRVYGVQLGRAAVDIADLREAVLSVEGEASGPTREFLRFVDDSPVAEWTHRSLSAAEVSGDARLALQFTLPLHEPTGNRVAGEVSLLNNQLKLAGLPTLAQVNGRIAFANGDVRAREVTAEALGGPVRVAIGSTEGGLRVTASGNADLQAVRREFAWPLSEHVSGNADWTLSLDTRGEHATWVVESPLRGVAIDLPPPARKAAAETLPMRIERRAAGKGDQEDLVLASFGDIAQMVAHRRLEATGARVDRASIVLGRSARGPEPRATRPGLWLRADLPELDIDQWITVAHSASAARTPGNGEDLALNGVDLDLGSATVFGRDFKSVKVSARHQLDEWKLDLGGTDITGSATWSAPGPAAPNGRVVARLARLKLSPANAAADASGTASPPSSASAWPELDVSADAFTSKGHDLGRMELVAKPRSAEWRIERLVIANESGRFEGSGAWRAGGRPDQTKLDMVLDVKDAGGFLAHFDHAGAVQGAPTKITGQLAWAGDPSDFDYPTLSGGFRIEVGNGRFLKIEPGLGKLLGVLSLQALPRRISLDFRDVFSEGFTFDRVTGNVRIAQGVMSTDDLRLTGPSAQIAIAGDADLAKETQRLQVRVQPTLSAGISAGAALLFLANPIMGAAVGAGSLLAQKMLRDPIEKIFSYEYLVTGSWSDPQVARGATATASVPDESTTK